MIENPLEANIPKKATRDGYGNGLLEVGKNNSKVVVLEADLSGSTKTAIFKKEYPKRFFNFGIAEQNMVGNAAGFAQAGYIPVASSFAIFLSGRAWEIVRNATAYPNLNVNLAATHAGITLGEDGASHQSVEDIALMRVIPNMTVIVPSDYWQAYKAIQAAVELNSPVYLRYGRPAIPMMYNENDSFEIGKGKIVQEGDKVAFFATGIMVFEAWKAARLLEEKTGIRPYVVDFSTVKPLDEELLADVSSRVKKIFTFEEHNIIGGFGSAIAEFMSEHNPMPIKRIGVKDEFGQSGTIQALMDHYRLSGEKLAEDLEDEIRSF